MIGSAIGLEFIQFLINDVALATQILFLISWIVKDKYRKILVTAEGLKKEILAIDEELYYQ